MKITVGTVAVVAGVLLLGGCVGPSRTDDDYAHKVANTAETLGSVVASAQLVAQAAGDKRAFATYVESTLNDAVDDASAIQSGFDAVQSPSEQSDKLRTGLDTVMTDTSDLLTTMLTEARRGHLDRLPGLAKQLDPIGEKLDRLAEAA